MRSDTRYTYTTNIRRSLSPPPAVHSAPLSLASLKASGRRTRRQKSMYPRRFDRWPDRRGCAGARRRRGLGGNSPPRASFEANAHPEYKDRVVAAGVGDTARHLSSVQNSPILRLAGCATASCRNGRGVTIRCPIRSFRFGAAGDWSGPSLWTGVSDEAVLRISANCRVHGDLEEMSLLASELVGQTNRLMSAASIIDEMINGAEAVIRKRLGSMVVD